MKIRRVPIALRLFLTVLLTTLVITTVSLGVLHWTMQKNFAKYVADVEMQKLDHLIDNLAGVYSTYHDWGNAIQAQILQIEGHAAPDDYDRLSRWWLRRQYDIALQQRYFKENTKTLLSDVSTTEVKHEKQILTEQELQALEENLPSEFQPFEGLKFPLSANQNVFRPDRKKEEIEQESKQNTGKKQFISTPDRLGLSSRLSLYDTQRQFVVGEPSDDQVSFRPIMVNNQVVGYLGLKPVLDQDDALSINFFSNQKRYLLLVYGLTVFASLIAALLLATYFKTPIQRLLNGTRELTKGNFQHQVKVNRNDELGDLSNELNQLAVILDQHEISRRQWVSDTSHELKTPLAVPALDAGTLLSSTAVTGCSTPLCARASSICAGTVGCNLASGANCGNSRINKGSNTSTAARRRRRDRRGSLPAWGWRANAANSNTPVSPAPMAASASARSAAPRRAHASASTRPKAMNNNTPAYS